MEKWCLFYSDALCLTADAWAAWAQAILTFVAIVGTFLVANHQTREAWRLNREQQKRESDRLAQIRIDDEVESLRRVYSFLRGISASLKVAGRSDHGMQDWLSNWERAYVPHMEYCMECLSAELLHSIPKAKYLDRVLHIKSSVKLLQGTVEQYRLANYPPETIDRIRDPVRTTSETVDAQIDNFFADLVEDYENHFEHRIGDF